MELQDGLQRILACTENCYRENAIPIADGEEAQMISRFSSIAAMSALALLLAGCTLNVDKDAAGKEKKVQIDTPFGGLHVKTDDVKAIDVGLPEYPGSAIEADKDGNKSADVHLGFGDWQLRVKAVKYASSDSQDKVLAFYKKSLGRYGDVLTCQNGKPVGQPTITKDGLTCEKKKHSHVKVDTLDDEGIDLDQSLELKTGSESHQRIVGFSNDVSGGKTRFALVLLDLPKGMNDKSESN